jgi:hypothetical protein
MRHHALMTASDPGRNLEGLTTAITVFSAVKQWGRWWLLVLFALARRFPSLTKTLRDLQFIGFARWCLIRELPYNGPPQKPGKLRYLRLFFESNFNGSWGEYIDAFANKLSTGMRLFWGSSYGFPGPLPTDQFKRYIARHETEADHYYVAYDATTTQILRALDLAGVRASSGPGVDSGSSGQARAFMAMCPVSPEKADALVEHLRGLDPGPFAKLPRTHMARLVVIRGFAHDPSWGVERDDLDVSYLVFTSNHDGPTDSHLDALCALPEVSGIWGSCVGCPAMARGPALKDYLLHNEIRTGLFFAAYGDATVQQVQDALERYPGGEEWVSGVPAVRVHVARAVRLAAEAYQRAYVPGTFARRDQHAHEYGTINGTLRVTASNVPEDMRAGLFAQDRELPVVARVSPNKAVPRIPGFRPPIGIALKIQVDELTVQDFIFGGIDQFFAKDAEAAVDLVIAQSGGAKGLGRYIYPSWNPKRWRLREAGILLKTLTQLDANPLGGDYNTQIVVSCGSLVVKAGLVPQTPDLRSWWRRSSRNPKRALIAVLEAGPVTFDFMLQRQSLDDPVNDPTRRWQGPWEKVGEIEFPSQELENGEELSFSLANTLPEHRARGEISELRIAVYADRAAERARINAAL